jgi:hypothetical protein
MQDLVGRARPFLLNPMAPMLAVALSDCPIEGTKIIFATHSRRNRMSMRNGYLIIAHQQARVFLREQLESQPRIARSTCFCKGFVRRPGRLGQGLQARMVLSATGVADG